MTKTDLTNTEADGPAHSLPPPLQALWWLRKGGLRMGPEWEKAHAICQTREGDHDHDIVHALAHLIEGDTANAGYWYRRAGEPPATSIEAEWDRLTHALSA